MDLKLLDTILECSVCLERLKQDARVLPCQHTFCLDCLKRVANKNPQTALLCPECRQQTNTCEMDTLPKNVFLIRLLDQITQTSSTQGYSKNDENSTPISISSVVSSSVFTTTTTTTNAATTKTTQDSESQPSSASKATPATTQNHNNIPYAKALYDFVMNPMDDEGCIKFQKGMIIQVTRRVDQNWAEGKIDETFGIFPLSFVQLNPAATALMQSYATKWRLPASISPEHAPSTSTNQRSHPVLQPTPANQNTSPICPTIPSSKSGVYLAIHNYVPVKPDELELKKGSQYIVTEACHDGWLRGSCSDNPTKKGSFPGNYVISLTYHQKIVAMQQQQKRNAALQSLTANLNTQQASRATGAYTNLALSSLPPELPQRNNTNKSNMTNNSSPSAQPPQMMKTEITNEIKKRESVSDILLKKLGYKKMNENSASYSMDNPVFEDSTVTATSNNQLSQYNHMRSGSCPSTFQPTTEANKLAANSNLVNKMKFGSHSQRVKTRQRPSLPLSSNPEDLATVTQQKRHSINLSAPPTTSNEFQNTQQQQQFVAYHRKSSSLDTTIDGTVAASAAHQPERYRCVTKYPAVSRVELSLNVGDIIILQKKRPNGWYKGELSRTGQIGLFPANFVELIE